MADNTDDEKDNRRTEIKDLPRPEEELSADEQKNVQGGATRIVPPGIRTTTPTSGGGSGDSAESYTIWPADREN